MFLIFALGFKGFRVQRRRDTYFRT